MKKQMTGLGIALVAVLMIIGVKMTMDKKPSDQNDLGEGAAQVTTSLSGDEKDSSKDDGQDGQTDTAQATTEFRMPDKEVLQSSDQNNPSIDIDGEVTISDIEHYEEAEVASENVAEDKIKVVSIGSYSGPFVEDGSDEEVYDILSMVVTNTSEEFLQYSQIILKDGERTATFAVSNLPSGASALVLEANRMDADGNWTYLDDTSAFLEEALLYRKKFFWEAGDYFVRLKNKTDQSYSQVFVYYKNVENGIYMGGITYRVKFDDVQPKESREKLSMHFTGNNSHVMMIDYIN